MTPIQQAELTLLRLKARLATRQQDLAIAQKANRDTKQIESQILAAQRSISVAELQLVRWESETKR